MRLAILSDVHGNPIALDAVLSDVAERGGADGYWVLGDLVPSLVSAAQGLAWTHGYLAATGWIGWLAAVRLEQRLILPDGTRLLGAHAAPGTDDGPGVQPGSSDLAIACLVEGCDADLVCVGHTHRAVDRRVGSVRIVNVGSVSNPLGSDRRASYAVLAAEADGYQITLQQVAYNTDVVIRAISEHHMFPNPEWLVAKFADSAPISTPSPEREGHANR